MEKSLEFKMVDDEAMKAFAIITAEWTRQGVTFTVGQFGGKITATLTGGF